MLFGNASDSVMATESVEFETIERDRESGEIATCKMFVLRKPPDKHNRHILRDRTCVGSDRYCIPYCQLFLQQCYSRRLRIQDTMSGISLRLQEDKNTFYHQQATVGPMGVDPLLYMYWKNCKDRPIFRVPVKHIQENPRRKKPARAERAQFINIWEEFIHGTAVINKSYTKNIRKPDKSLAAALQNYLGQFLSQTLVNTVIYFVHFIIYFLSMCVYNMFWSCLGYILLDGHIKIHERAYKANINLVFGGSIFQGPAYILVRDWCEHCQQMERERMSIRLMKKMKRDILDDKRYWLQYAESQAKC